MIQEMKHILLPRLRDQDDSLFKVASTVLCGAAYLSTVYC